MVSVTVGGSRIAAFNLSIDTVSRRPCICSTKNLSFRCSTSKGPRYGGCSGRLTESSRTKTCVQVASSFCSLTVRWLGRGLVAVILDLNNSPLSTITPASAHYIVLAQN